MKDNVPPGRTLFANCIVDKGLVSRKYIACSKVNGEKNPKLAKQKMGKRHRHFSKENGQMANK